MSVFGRPTYRLYQWLWVGLDWLYPPLCGGCGKTGERWCTGCQNKVRLIQDPICQKCGKTISEPGICPVCKAHPPVYEALRSWGYFEGPLRHALHRLKYQRDIALAENLSRHLISLIEKYNWRVEIVCPVPLGIARQAERGYNQAALLAYPLKLGLQLAYVPDSLWRQRETRTQVGLKVEERKQNVSGAFCADRQRVSGAVVLVVDDVTTTGATLEACAQALLDAGAQRVYCLSLGRAVLGARSDDSHPV